MNALFFLDFQSKRMEVINLRVFKKNAAYNYLPCKPAFSDVLSFLYLFKNLFI